MATSDKPQPWERMPDESDKAFSAFCMYRDMPTGKRSMEKVSQERTWNVRRWHVKYNWVARVRAWEDEQDRIARKAKTDAIKRMNERHVQMAQGMIAKAAERLRSMNVNELTPAETRLYFNDAARLERLAMGEAETSTQVSGALELIVTFKTQRISEIEDDADA